MWFVTIQSNIPSDLREKVALHTLWDFLFTIRWLKYKTKFSYRFLVCLVFMKFLGYSFQNCIWTKYTNIIMHFIRLFSFLIHYFNYINLQILSKKLTSYLYQIQIKVDSSMRKTISYFIMQVNVFTIKLALINLC